ncbi:MAG: hypothetical protein JW983_03450 [Elusimicrobia bacterium]|nr:hypothetical protein [Elusimicrobiota bacterium]
MKRIIFIILIISLIVANGCIISRHTFDDVSDPNKSYEIEKTLKTTEEKQSWKKLKNEKGFIIIKDSIDKQNEIKEKEREKAVEDSIIKK